MHRLLDITSDLGHCPHLPAEKQNKNKVGQPHKRFQSQGHIKWPIVVARFMLTACLVVEMIQR